MFGDAAPHLQAAYNYLQAARDDSDVGLSNLYKLVETVEFGWSIETVTGATLGMKPERDLILRLANQDSYDQRHAPRSPTQPQTISDDEQLRAYSAAGALVTTFAEAVWPC